VTNYSAFSYFLIATIVLGLCIVLFFILMKLPFTIFHLRGQGQAKKDVGCFEEPLLNATEFNEDNEQGSETGGETASQSSDSYASSLGLSGIMKRNQERSLADTDLPNAGNPMQAGNQSDSCRAVPFNESRIMTSDSDQDNTNGMIGDAMGISTLGNIIAVFKIIKIPALTVYGVFAVTLALFPTLTIFLTSTLHRTCDCWKLCSHMFDSNEHSLCRHCPSDICSSFLLE
jgi:hypothetical protein